MPFPICEKKTRDFAKGQCCCNCNHQIEIKMHPWNRITGKGSISEIFGYGCYVAFGIDGVKTATFQEEKHGCCELWQKKRNVK